MLSEEERREIDEELKNHAHRRGAAPQALKIVQRQRGWISDEALNATAQHLGLSAEELDEIATFYNLIFRRPVGRHIILVCDSVSCWVMGYTTLRPYLQERLGISLGETTQDGRFTLLPTVCLGACDHAPVMMIDEDLIEDLTPDKIDGVLARYE